MPSGTESEPMPVLAATGREIEMTLIPDEIAAALSPAEEAGNSFPRCAMWHRVQTRPGARVSLRSGADRLRVIRLSVESDAPGWNPRWVRWTYAVRRAPESLGGDALAAQDRLGEEDAALTLLLLPGEQRSATVEFLAALDGRTVANDYPFQVVVREQEDIVAQAAGRLCLRHPAPKLLDHLPALYRLPREAQNRLASYEDPPFFERFLRGFEDAEEPMRELISRLGSFFDPAQAPSEFLPWLATWVSLALDENWPDLKRRRLIKEAVELFRWRGTRRGLARYLEIYTGVVPQIHDQPFAGMRLGSDTLLGRDTILGGVPAHTFVVTLPVPDPSRINVQIVRDIIESEKPAHTAYDVRIVRRLTGEEE